MDALLLNSGQMIPRIGLGTYLIPKDKLSFVIGKAFAMGYRQFDTAWKYHNEKEIAIALKENGINRKDVFITSKFSIYANCKSISFRDHLYCLKYRSIHSVIEEQLRALDTDYIDLYLMHWPYPQYESIWKTMTSYFQKGVFRSIGVCSFLPQHLEALRGVSDIVPAVNQFEISPLNTQKKLIRYCTDHGIAVEAMSTFSKYHSNEAREEIINNEVIKTIATAHGKTTVQVVLRWMYQQNILLIPKTWDIDHLKENISILDFSLSDDEMKQIDDLDQGHFLNYNPYKAKQGFMKQFDSYRNE